MQRDASRAHPPTRALDRGEQPPAWREDGVPRRGRGQDALQERQDVQAVHGVKHDGVVVLTDLGGVAPGEGLDDQRPALLREHRPAEVLRLQRLQLRGPQVGQEAEQQAQRLPVEAHGDERRRHALHQQVGQRGPALRGCAPAPPLKGAPRARQRVLEGRGRPRQRG